MLVKQPEAVYVEQVYLYGDFSLLGDWYLMPGDAFKKVQSGLRYVNYEDDTAATGPATILAQPQEHWTLGIIV